MIYYATVHWKSDRWIDIQHSMLARYTDVPYRVYAYLNDIDQEHNKKFDVILDDDDPGHDVKLDKLARRIIDDGARDEDWIIFIDGDAFPIAPVHAGLKDFVKAHELVAVQRTENLGEKQPHPCFCITTVALWKRIKGTWAMGYKWLSALGMPTTDVGGELLSIVDKHQINWLPLRRTNTLNLNSVFYAIYGNIVYHHGAGFRILGCRQIYYDDGMFDVYKRPDARILNNIVTKKYLTKMRDSLIHPEGRWKRRIHNRLAPIEKQVYQMIKADPESVRMFIK